MTTSGALELVMPTPWQVLASSQPKASVLARVEAGDDTRWCWSRVKNLLTINPEDEMLVKNVTIRKIPRVPENMPLYDILNEFQKGNSHMAVVVKQSIPIEQPSKSADVDARMDIDSHKLIENGVNDVILGSGGDKPTEKAIKSKRLLQKWQSYPGVLKGSNSGNNRSRKWARDIFADVLQINNSILMKLNEEEEAVGVITMEDVIEELLQEEIYDETDNQDVSIAKDSYNFIAFQI